MQQEIYLRKHIHVNINTVAEALKSIPSYLYHLTPKRKNQPTAHQETFTIGENVQGTVNKRQRLCNILKEVSLHLLHLLLLQLLLFLLFFLLLLQLLLLPPLLLFPSAPHVKNKHKRCRN
jgi:hypothetical protein